MCNGPVIAIRRSVIRDCTLRPYAVASLYGTVDIPIAMSLTYLEWYSFAYGMYQGNDFGARIRSLSSYGIKDHGTLMMPHFCHFSLSDRNHVGVKEARGDRGP